jgi:hypothetical protein
LLLGSIRAARTYSGRRAIEDVLSERERRRREIREIEEKGLLFLWWRNRRSKASRRRKRKRTERERERERESEALSERERGETFARGRKRGIIIYFASGGEREGEIFEEGGICFVSGGERRRAGKGGRTETQTERREFREFIFSSRGVFLVVSSQCPTQRTKKLFLRKLYVEEQVTRIPKIRGHTIRRSRSRSRSQATMMGAMAQTGSDRLPPDHHLNAGRFLEVLES